MNKAYERSIVLLSERMAQSPMTPTSPGSHLAKQRAFATDQSSRGKQARVEFGAARRRAAMDRQLAHTDPTEGPSLHEDYLRMAELMLKEGLLKKARNVALGVGGLIGGSEEATAQTPPKDPTAITKTEPKGVVRHRGGVVKTASNKPVTHSGGSASVKTKPETKPKATSTPVSDEGGGTGTGWLAAAGLLGATGAAAGANWIANRGKRRRTRPRPLARNRQDTNTSPPEGPSLHEDYLRMAELMLKEGLLKKARNVALGTALSTAACVGPTCDPQTSDDKNQQKITVGGSEPFDPMTKNPDDFVRDLKRLELPNSRKELQRRRDALDAKDKPTVKPPKIGIPFFNTQQIKAGTRKAAKKAKK